MSEKAAEQAKRISSQTTSEKEIKTEAKEILELEPIYREEAKKLTALAGADLDSSVKTMDQRALTRQVSKLDVVANKLLCKVGVSPAKALSPDLATQVASTRQLVHVNVDRTLALVRASDSTSKQTQLAAERAVLQCTRVVARSVHAVLVAAARAVAKNGAGVAAAGNQ